MDDNATFEEVPAQNGDFPDRLEATYTLQGERRQTRQPARQKSLNADYDRKDASAKPSELVPIVISDAPYC